MALIKCANCGHMISDRAIRCPKCGTEIISQRTNNDIKNIQVPKKTKKVIEVDEEKLKKDNWGKTSIALAVFLILIVAFVVSQYGFGGFGIYGTVVLAIVSILLVCKGIAAINYLKTGNAKMLLYYLKTKGMTYLLFLLGITGVVGLGVDVYQGVEYDKLVEAENCVKYSFFKADAPLFVKWSYCKWDKNDKLCAYSVVASYGTEKYKWDEDVNEVAFSAHLCSNNSHETQSLLRLSIVHNEDSRKRDLPFDVILLGFNKAHTEHFSIYHEYDDEIPVNIRIDDESTLKFKCHYTTNYDDWYSLLIYGKQYETLLAKLKTGKACTITIDDVDKVYKFDIEDLKWSDDKSEIIDKEKTVESENRVEAEKSSTNSKSEVEITPRFIEKIRKYDKLGGYSEGLALVQRNGKWGYIDIYGDEIIQCQFDGEQYGGKWGHHFSEGLAVVIKDGKYGYIDKNGNVIININYKEAGDFSNGIACVMEYDKDKLSFIDKNGNLIEHLSNKYVRDDVGGLPQFENGVCQVLVEKPKEEQREGDWNRSLWINTKGEEVTHPQSIAVKDELELFWIDDKCGLKDAQGNVIVEAKYSSIGHFSHGVAVASLNNGMEVLSGATTDGYFEIYGYVNMNGDDTFTNDDFQRIEDAYRNNPNPL